jgi:pantothenate kinase-related protein Tda10
MACYRRSDWPDEIDNEPSIDGKNLPSPCVVILVGPGASGKSTWAADGFALLEQVVRQRIERRLTTVIDTLGLDRECRYYVF